jgi:hypothetical protein
LIGDLTTTGTANVNTASFVDVDITNDNGGVGTVCPRPNVRLDRR